MNGKEIRVAELFAGIGGFRLGLERSNFKVVWANDWKWAEAKSQGGRWNEQKQYYELLDSKTGKWKKATENKSGEIYTKHWNDGSYIDQDICTVDPKDIPDINMLCGGFPCQPFSLAGKRQGFKDIRGTMFFEIARIAEAKKPSLLLLENVKGLLSHDNGDTFEVITRTLDELGYDVEWQVFNSKYFGVPQNRERVFIIGHLRGTSTKQIFPICKSDSLSFEDEEGEQGISSCLDANYFKGARKQRTFVRTGEGGVTAILADNLGGNIKQRQKDVSSCAAWTLGGSKTLIAQALQTDGFLRAGSSFGTNNPQSSRNIRRLTPTECERLQGFPDGWTGGVSDTQRYKCLGNAVTVNVVQFLGERLLASFGGKGKEVGG